MKNHVEKIERVEGVLPGETARAAHESLNLLYQTSFGAKALAGMVLIGAMEFYGDTVRESASSR